MGNSQNMSEGEEFWCGGFEPHSRKKAQAVTLFAWIGEDELGSGETGLKQAVVPAGTIPLISLNRKKLERAAVVKQLKKMNHHYGKTIYLCEMKVEKIITRIGDETDEAVTERVKP